MKFELPFWKQAPFTRLLFPAMTGISLARYLSLPHFYLGMFLFALFLFLLLHLLPVKFVFRVFWATGVFSSIALLGLFAWLTGRSDVRTSSNWFGHYKNIQVIEIKINEPLESNGKYLRTIASVEQILVNKKFVPASGNVMLNFEIDSSSRLLKPGTVLLLRSPVFPIKNMGNPGGFDYETYAAFKGVFHQSFAGSKDWKILAYRKPNFVRSAIFNMRNYVVESVDRYFPNDENVKAVTKALLVGYKADLDKELQQSYSNTGVIHVVAISGLHLGLVYLILTNMLSRIPGLKKKIMLQSVLCILGLWVFSFISGASASVLRSAVMFTFMLTGRAFNYKGSIANALASSAFFLLLYNPYFLWDIGFQLSYLAVIGIVSLQDPLFRLMYIKNVALRYLWKASTVSLSAQLVTLPVCLFYFHQFPNYFLLANLIVVPLSSLILILGFAVICVSWIPVLAVLLGKLCFWLVFLMNSIVTFIDRLPGATITGIYFHIVPMVLLSVAIFFIVGAVQKKSFFFLNLALCFIAALLIFQTTMLISRGLEPKMVFYNIPHQSAIHCISNRKAALVADSAVAADPKYQNQFIKPALANFGAQATDQPSSLQDRKSIWFYNTQIIIVDSTLHFPLVHDAVDILLLTQNTKIDLEELVSSIKPGMIVFDASNSLWKIAKWKSICEQLALPCFSIPEQGAFIYYPLHH